jgi:hypothetical protein
MQQPEKTPNPLPLDPALKNRRADITLDPQVCKRNGLAQRISNLIAATMAAGAGFGMGAAPGPDNITCRLYLINDTRIAAHLEITYRDSASGASKPFEKYGSRHNLIGEIADGKIEFAPRFMDDLPLTPDQKTFFEETLKPFC